MTSEDRNRLVPQSRRDRWESGDPRRGDGRRSPDSPEDEAAAVGGQSGHSGHSGPSGVAEPGVVPTSDTAGPQNFTQDDAQLLDAVVAALQDCELDASRIEVRVTNAEVTLEGTVEDALARGTAGTVAERVPGVKCCHNLLAMDRRDSRGSAPAS